MTTAIITCWHCYTPDYGREYYAPILDFYLQTMKKYRDEYDQLYLVDSNWKIPPSPDYTVLKVNPHLRYYDAYKEVLPQIKEDLVLFLDNDSVIYRKGVIVIIFDKLKYHDVASIYDTIGTFHSPLLNGKSKFCLYFMAGKTELFKKYLDVDWGPQSWGETLSALTKKMLEDGIKPYEFEEDKSSLLFGNYENNSKSKDLGYMHIRSGSISAVLLAWKSNASQTYWEYIKGQPKTEYLRQCFWFDYMNRKTTEGIWKMSDMGLIFCLMLKDMGVKIENWKDYYDKCLNYYNLPQ